MRQNLLGELHLVDFLAFLLISLMRFPYCLLC